jgi:N-6 DNA Methylase
VVCVTAVNWLRPHEEGAAALASTNERASRSSHSPRYKSMPSASQRIRASSALEPRPDVSPTKRRILDPELELRPERVRNDVMGDIFEELIRRFSEISNEMAGEHFTQREVVRLSHRSPKPALTLLPVRLAPDPPLARHPAVRVISMGGT